MLSSAFLLLGLGLFAAPTLALRYMLDSVNEHYTSRGRCILYKIPGHSLVTGKVSAIAPANGKIGAYVRRYYRTPITKLCSLDLRFKR